MQIMKTFSALIASALLVMGNAQAEAVTYNLDTKGMHASINFKVKHLGYSWLKGRFDDFTGLYRYDKENLANSSIEVEIDTGSVNSNHAERDKHLRGDEFLNVDEHPKAMFKSTSISGTDEAMQVKGDFTLNGVTRAITIEAHKIGEGKDPWGGYRSGFSGTTTLKLANFDITKDLGPASTHVQLSLEIEGIRQ